MSRFYYWDTDLGEAVSLGSNNNVPSAFFTDPKIARYCAEDVKMLRKFHQIMNRKSIAKVIFNDPATIVFWNDGTKTVVKAVNEPFDPEKGLAMAIAKYHFGNGGSYYNVFKQFLPKKKEM